MLFCAGFGSLVLLLDVTEDKLTYVSLKGDVIIAFYCKSMWCVKAVNDLK